MDKGFGHCTSLTDAPFGNFHLIFLIQLSKYLGFYPSESNSTKQEYFNMESGSFEGNPYSEQFLSLKSTTILKSLMKLSYLDRDLLKITSSERRQLLSEIIRFYQLHMPGMGQITSQEVLESVFN